MRNGLSRASLYASAAALIAIVFAAVLLSGQGAQAGQVCLSCWVATPMPTEHIVFGTPEATPAATSRGEVCLSCIGETATPGPAGCNIGDTHNCTSDAVDATATPATQAQSCSPIDPRCGAELPTATPEPRPACTITDPRCP